jgi:hypothetical protein
MGLAESYLAFSFSLEPNGQLVPNEKEQSYKEIFGWGDARDAEGNWNEGLWSVDSGEATYSYKDVSLTAEELLKFARGSTYPEWRASPCPTLKILGELSIQSWHPRWRSDPDHNTEPHQDWTTRKPVIIGLASKAYINNFEDWDSGTLDGVNDPTKIILWNGDYKYKGDLTDNTGAQIDYTQECESLGPVKIG